MSRRIHTWRGDRCLLLLLLVLTPLLQVAIANAHPDGSYPRTANHDWRAELEVERNARYDVVVTMTRTQNSKLDSLRLLNPSIIRLMSLSWYVPFHAGPSGHPWPYPPWEVDDPHFGWDRRYWDLMEENDWWLTGVDSSGTRYKAGVWFNWWTGNFSSKCPPNSQGQRLCDVFADYLIEHVISKKNIEGLFFDNCWDGPVHLHWQMWGACQSGTDCTDPATPKSPETEFAVGFDLDEDGVADHPDSLKAWWSAGVSIVMNRLRERLGPDFYLVGNGRHHFSMMNGAMYERYPRVHGALDPAPNPANYRWNGSTLSPTIGYLTFAETFYSEPLLNIIDTERTGISQYQAANGSSHERFKRWTLGSTLLGDGYFAAHGTLYHDMWWEPEYELRLGFPTGPAYSVVIDGQTIWRRDFTNGEVWVNPGGIHVAESEFNPGISGRDAVILQKAVDAPLGNPASVRRPRHRECRAKPESRGQLDSLSLGERRGDLAAHLRRGRPTRTRTCGAVLAPAPRRSPCGTDVITWDSMHRLESTLPY